MPKKRYQHTTEHNQKIREANLGKHNTPESFDAPFINISGECPKG